MDQKGEGWGKGRTAPVRKPKAPPNAKPAPPERAILNGHDSAAAFICTENGRLVLQRDDST
jgi:hypothetical protein